MIFNKRKIGRLIFNKRVISRIVYNKTVVFNNDNIYLYLEKDIVNLLFNNNLEDTTMVYTNTDFQVS
jgi:hypothetical protein|nr:MAG TPA: hypothetical protein [Caudoviricetes sp.]